MNRSDVFFEDLGIAKPDYNQGVGSGSHGVQTGRMLEAILARIGKRGIETNPFGDGIAAQKICDLLASAQ